MTDLTRDEQIIYDAARDIDIDRERVDKFTSALARLGYTLARQPAEVQEPVAWAVCSYLDKNEISAFEMTKPEVVIGYARPLIFADAPLPDTVSVPDAWIAVGDGLPDVPRGKDMFCWVCVKLDSGKLCVYECYYVNRPVDEDADGREHGWEITDEDGDPLDAVGWFNVGCNTSYDDFYMADQNADKIIAWQEIPKPAAPHK